MFLIAKNAYFLSNLKLKIFITICKKTSNDKESHLE